MITKLTYLCSHLHSTKCIYQSLLDYGIFAKVIKDKEECSTGGWATLSLRHIWNPCDKVHASANEIFAAFDFLLLISQKAMWTATLP